MKTETKRLLSDLLDDVAPAEFRAELLESTLAHVRQRKRTQRVCRATLAMAVAAAAMVLWTEHAAKIPNRLASEGVSMVASAPSGLVANVSTAPGAATVIESSKVGFAMIETNPAHPEFRNLTDDELLALSPGQAGVLVRSESSETILLITDPGTQLVSVAGEPEVATQSEPIK